MATRDNPRLLVLRRDTATGLTQVGWETDLPIGRFEHLEVVCELNDNRLPNLDNEHYVEYQAALLSARETNASMLDEQSRHHMTKGWLFVPFELSPKGPLLVADIFGSFSAAAMKLLFQLTHNTKQVWAVLQDGCIVHVRSRRPTKNLDELSYQVWYHQQLHQLEKIGGKLLEGNLMVCESGLWFIPNNSLRHHN